MDSQNLATLIAPNILHQCKVSRNLLSLKKQTTNSQAQRFFYAKV